MKRFLIMLILISIFALPYSVWAQEKETSSKKVKQQSLEGVTHSSLPAEGIFTKEDIIKEAQKNLKRNVDRDISFLTLVVTIIGCLIAFLTLLAVIAVALGFFEIRKWKKMRDKLEKIGEEGKKRLDDIEKSAKETKERADAFVRWMEEEKENMRTRVSVPSLTEIPSEEVKQKLDKYARRIELLEEVGVQPKPEDYFNRGIHLYYKGKYELALKAFEKAIELKPDYAKAWYSKGVILGKLGRREEELKAYEKAIELKPDYAEAWYNKACMYSLRGDKENALKNLSKAIELNSEDKEKAKKDEDFKNLWDDKDFKKLVE